MFDGLGNAKKVEDIQNLIHNHVINRVALMKYCKYTFLVLIFLYSCQPSLYRTEKISQVDNQLNNTINNLYQKLELDGQLEFKIFRMAMVGFHHIDIPNKSVISIINYSLPSTEKRFYLIDLVDKKLLYNTYIAHGVNSGENVATVFSNVPESRKSSIGFFVTAESYMGSNGYSLRIDGIEKGINHNARKRDIVIHKADYVSDAFIEQEGRLGRSWGCPALPNDVSHDIIDIIKEGTCIFVYGDDRSYLEKSNYIEK
jgi:hypothetical protein